MIYGDVALGPLSEQELDSYMKLLETKEWILKYTDQYYMSIPINIGAHNHPDDFFIYPVDVPDLFVYVDSYPYEPKCLIYQDGYISNVEREGCRLHRIRCDSFIYEIKPFECDHMTTEEMYTFLKSYFRII